MKPCVHVVWVTAGIIAATACAPARVHPEAHAAADGGEDDAMTTPERQAALDAELRELLKPWPQLSGPDTQLRMARTVGEGLSVPGVDRIIAERVLPGEIKAMHDHTVKWLRTIVRERSLPADLPDRLYGVRKATRDLDAFVAVWRTGGRVLQSVVTRERIHLLTRLGRTIALTSENEAELLKACVALANDLFELPSPLKAEGWRARRFGGMLLATREVGFARNWNETLLILTDGDAVKYSVLKYKDETSPPEKESVVEDLRPWFPPK
jgi:hypothetical protein